MTGFVVKQIRNEIGLSQSKLAEITGVKQARISAYELGKLNLNLDEVKIITNSIRNMNSKSIQILKKKRYQKSGSTDNVLEHRPKRNYLKTNNNGKYLATLNKLEKNFNNNESTGLKAISFFAGGGGLCYGIKAAGFDIVATNELVESYKDIYKLNFPKAFFLKNDIQKISNDDIEALLKTNKKIDILVGGPPCQGFSLAGKREVNDKRNTLFEDYLRIAKQIMPRVVLIENVKLLTSMKDSNGKLVKDRILSTFDSIGYNSKFFIVNAKNYGVPQHRERVIFLGLKKDINKQISMPKQLCEDNTSLFDKREPYFTFGDAVSDLTYLESGERDPGNLHHWSVNHPQHVVKWLIDVPQGKSAHDNADPKLRPPSGYNTTYKRQEWNKPAGTVATTYGMISGCRNVHPIATRALTTREALRLQSFPDSFKVTGKTGDIRTIIGNAVPPLLAFELANYIRLNYM